MKLRARLALTLLILVVPLALGLSVLQSWIQRRMHDESFADAITWRMESHGRARCELMPERWPRAEAPMHRPHKRRHRPRAAHRQPEPLFAYDSRFVSHNPDAPSFPTTLREELDVETVYAAVTEGAGRDRRRVMAVRMPWNEGPCAIVVGSRPERRPRGAVLHNWVTPLLVSLLAVGMTAFAVGPIVRRVRRLTERVRGDGAARLEADQLKGNDEIAELGRAFESNRLRIADQLQKLRERDAALSEYIANTTHDVILPLTVLQGHLSRMQQRMSRGEPVEARLVEDAIEESHYLASLVHNLSAAARLDGTVETAQGPVDLNALIERVVARHRIIAEQRGVALNHAVPEEQLTARGDITLLEQAISNIVHNAVRYNGADGHVAVILERDGSSFNLQVTDDGPGIAQEDLAHLGQRHFRATRARTRQPHGLGLGLHIAKDVADRHGYSLTFTPQHPTGLQVTLRGSLQLTG